MSDKIEPIGVSIDKLTVLADLRTEIHHKDFCERIEKLGFVPKKTRSGKFGYGDVYIHPDNAGYIEFAVSVTDYKAEDLMKKEMNLWRIIRDIEMGEPNHTGETLDELNTRLENIQDQLADVDDRGYLRRLRDVRYELNPKYFDYVDGIKDIFIEIMSAFDLESLKLSSIHVAIDYPVDINEIEVVDTKSREETIFKSKDKRIATMYFGKQISRSQLCVYDKKRENKVHKSIDQYPDVSQVTRFEARLKNNYARDFFVEGFIPFLGLNVGQNVESVIKADKSLNPNQRVHLMTYFRHPDMLEERSLATKKRYKKLLQQYTGLQMDVVNDYRQQKNSLIAELESWFEASKETSFDISDKESISEEQDK